MLVIKVEPHRLIHVFVYYCLDKLCILFLAFQPSCEHAKTRLCRLFCFVCFLPGNKTLGSDAKSITHCEIFASKFKQHYDKQSKYKSNIYRLTLENISLATFRFIRFGVFFPFFFICLTPHQPFFQLCWDSDMVLFRK